MLRRAVTSTLRRAAAATARAPTAAAPSAAPAALRALCGRGAPTTLLPRCAAAVATTRGFAARAPPAPPSLGDALRAELAHELDVYETPELVKQGPPAPFDLTEEAGGSELTLTREFEDEEITISLTVDPGDNAQDLEAEGQEEGEEGEEDEEGEDEEVTIFFDVSISKPNQQTLTFECATDGMLLDIMHVGLEDEGDDAPVDGAYSGPAFGELDASVQDAFGAHLEARGVDSALLEYLLELSVDKEQREYVNWLKRTAEFVAPAKKAK